MSLMASVFAHIGYKCVAVAYPYDELTSFTLAVDNFSLKVNANSGIHLFIKLIVHEAREKA
jgi:hypothetical protein